MYFTKGLNVNTHVNEFGLIYVLFLTSQKGGEQMNSPILEVDIRGCWFYKIPHKVGSILCLEMIPFISNLFFLLIISENV